MVNRTKDAIKQTFLELLNEKPLNQITVKMIVEKCGINRNSFYYHYQDLPAVIEETVREEADRIMREYPSVDSIEIALQAAVDFAAKNRRAILHIYNSVNRELYEQYLWQVAEAVVTAYTDTILADTPINENDRRILIQFYKCACFGMTTEWIRTGMHSDVQQDIKRLCELQKGTTEEVIKRCIRQQEN